MTEAVSTLTEPDIMSMPDRNSTNERSAEIIDFPKTAEERVVGSFLGSVMESIERGSKSMEVAFQVQEALTTTHGEAVDDQKRELLEVVAAASASAQDDVFDHKEVHDPVFHRLVSTLQQTKSQQRSLHEQRRAALRLTELRSALSADETADDPKWHTIIDRLFGRPE